MLCLDSQACPTVPHLQPRTLTGGVKFATKRYDTSAFEEANMRALAAQVEQAPRASLPLFGNSISYVGGGDSPDNAMAELSTYREHSVNDPISFFRQGRADKRKRHSLPLREHAHCGPKQGTSPGLQTLQSRRCCN